MGRPPAIQAKIFQKKKTVVPKHLRAGLSLLLYMILNMILKEMYLTIKFRITRVLLNITPIMGLMKIVPF